MSDIVRLGKGEWAIKDGSVLAVRSVNDKKFYSLPFTVTRGTNATYVGKDGLIKTTPSFYNLLPYSEDFSGWTTTGTANVTPNTSIAPNGTQTASTLNIVDSTYFYKSISTGSGTFTLSCYVKVSSGTNDFKMQSFSGTDGANTSSVFTATTEWQRFEHTVTVSVDSNFYPVFISSPLTGGDFQIWGAQVVEGTEALDYQYTNGREGIPRIDFTDNTDGHLLLEPESRNLITYSEDFSQSNWTENDAQILSSTHVNPDGSNNAKVLAYDGGTVQHYVSTTPSVDSGQNYTFSVFVKAKELNYVCLVFLNDLSGKFFNLENGTRLGNFGSEPFDSKIEDYGNGWYRCSITDSATSTTKFCGIYLSDNGTSINSTPTTTNGVYIWGAQLEELSYPTSYIPTNGVQVTRLKDKCWNAGTQHDFDSSEGVLYYEAKFAKTGLTGLITIGDANGAPFLLLGHTGSISTPKLYFDINTGGGSIISPNSAKSDTPINIDNINKVALSWSPTGYKVYVNGALAHEENKQINMGTTTYGVLNNIYMGYSSSSLLYGNLKELKVYKKAMSASELVALTS